MSHSRHGLYLICASSVILAGCEALPELPNVPPTATFIHSPVSPILAGSTVVTFNAAGSRDTDGTIARYTWDFGDGTPQLTGERSVVTHVYADTAATCQETIFTALLTVADDKGDVGTASAEVHVIELPLPTSRECQDRLR
jgi:large repetitive protein